MRRSLSDVAASRAIECWNFFPLGDHILPGNAVVDPGTLPTMNVRERHVIGGGIVLAMAIVGILAYPRVPDQMVTHWGEAGPDGSTSKTVALVGLPALAAGMVLLFELLPRIDPLGHHLRDLGRYYDVLVVVVTGLVGYVHVLVVVWNVGYEFDVLQAIVPAVGAVLYVVGVIMERVEKNWFVGVRTPWTLTSDEVWERTHERAAPMFKVAALLTVGAVVLPEYALYFLVGPVAITATYLTVYSYFAYRNLGPDADENV